MFYLFFKSSLNELFLLKVINNSKLFYFILKTIEKKLLVHANYLSLDFFSLKIIKSIITLAQFFWKHPHPQNLYCFIYSSRSVKESILFYLFFWKHLKNFYCFIYSSVSNKKSALFYLEASKEFVTFYLFFWKQ